MHAGAIGTGILFRSNTICIISTLGVILAYEEDSSHNFKRKVHFFNYGKTDASYTTDAILSAGTILSWFKDTIPKDQSFNELLAGMAGVQRTAVNIIPCQ